MFNPAKASDEIKKEYIGYISTTFHFRDALIQSQLEKELNRTIANGPFIEIKDAFESGKSINQLIDDGVLSPLFRDLEKNKRYEPKLPLERPLYLHQEKAVEKIVSGKNVVVSTGTGSGKTHCFLIPVINELLREKEAGTLDDGVRAIFIYPMNALANDQIKGLREILMSYPDITFGVYNGGTEHKESDAIKLYEAMYANEKYPELQVRLSNEMLSRDEMKNSPPHILFTNYAMLEHLLFRPGDDVLFSKSNFKFVVLDEAHVYAGAVGIETALLMGRLKARLGDNNPQFILTSATLGDESPESDDRVVDFAQRLTGCDFSSNDIVHAYRCKRKVVFDEKYNPEQLYVDLANGDDEIKQILSKYSVKFNSSADDDEVLYDLIEHSDLYAAMRALGNTVTLDEFVRKLHISRDVAVSFVYLCARARKHGKILVDIRYHYFLKALDGGYMALDYPQSFSLTRKDNYEDIEKMFEVGVCDDCGEMAIIGKIDHGRLVRASAIDKRELFQIVTNLVDDQFEDEVEADAVQQSSEYEDYLLCKSCGAIVPIEESHNRWCTCGNTKEIKIRRLPKEKCLNCNGIIRRLQLGYEAATSVLATSLFEQIPSYSLQFDNNYEKKETKGRFTAALQRVKRKENTGKQFLVFSDSRQGAAKFACYLEDLYKEFLRRRGIWNIAHSEGESYPNGITISELVGLLDNFYSSNRIFRESNADGAPTDIVKNKRNAWVAVLNELFNSSRDTSLVSLGQLQFSYLGNTNEIVDVVAQQYNVDKDSAHALLDYLAMEIVRAGAIVADKKTDINDEDRKYIFFTQAQQVVTLYRNNALKNSHPFLPTQYQKKNGEKKYYRQKKVGVVKSFLNIDDKEAIDFLEDYWDFLTSSDNPYALDTEDGKGYFMRANCIRVYMGKSAKLWKCAKCNKVTQFNIGDKCCQPNCCGRLERLDSDEYCKKNHYAMLYENNELSPLFIKEHTAQLAKKEALAYQQMFVRKEINALSCSTTFEMGVDVGELETVFLRNIPPLSSNYAQRVGRAGRSAKAAAYALTYARLSSHDFTFFDRPEEMIKGVIYPPQFKLENEKIIKRHIYAVAISFYLKLHANLYDGNNAKAFINDKGYVEFLAWLNNKPDDLKVLLKKSIPNSLWNLDGIELDSFGWLEDFCGEKGKFTTLVKEFEDNIEYLTKEKEKARRADSQQDYTLFSTKLERYQRNELIDFLVRGNILPKYGFPVDSVELTQNIASKELKSLNLNRDLSVAIAEYAPSAEVVADGNLYTSRYIRKPIVNRSELSSFDISYIATCPECQQIDYSNMPIPKHGKDCATCGNSLKPMDYHRSIEPRAGFIAEQDIKPVPLSAQERKYKTEAIYIGDKNAYPISNYEYEIGGIKVLLESTANDSLVVKSTDYFYVCPKCGYAIASDETSKLHAYSDYRIGAKRIRDGNTHFNPFGKGQCTCTELERHWLHHEFKTDVAKITFATDTSDYPTMLSVMYALLNAFADALSVEKRDIRGCLTYKFDGEKYSHQIIIYDAVPGGAGHSRRLATESGDVLRLVIERAKTILSSCDCEPSCYKCLRSYDNQKSHEILDRQKALKFLSILCK